MLLSPLCIIVFKWREGEYIKKLSRQQQQPRQYRTASSSAANDNHNDDKYHRSSPHQSKEEQDLFSWRIHVQYGNMVYADTTTNTILNSYVLLSTEWNCSWWIALVSESSVFLERHTHIIAPILYIVVLRTSYCVAPLPLLLLLLLLLYCYILYVTSTSTVRTSRQNQLVALCVPYIFSVQCSDWQRL